MLSINQKCLVIPIHLVLSRKYSKSIKMLIYCIFYWIMPKLMFRIYRSCFVWQFSFDSNIYLVQNQSKMLTYNNSYLILSSIIFEINQTCLFIIIPTLFCHRSSLKSIKNTYLLHFPLDSFKYNVQIKIKIIIYIDFHLILSNIMFRFKWKWLIMTIWISYIIINVRNQWKRLFAAIPT
jgi:hypothetical protein